MRLIDKDYAVDTAWSIDAYHGSAREVCEMLEDAPTVESEPVRHGKWIDEGYYADNTNVKAWHCSECNWHMLGYGDELFRFCPSCGAKMDGAERKEE